MSVNKTSSETFLKDKQAGEFKDLREPYAGLLGGTMDDLGAFMSGNLTYGGPGDLDDYRAPMTSGEMTALDMIRGSMEGSQNARLASDLVGSTLSGDFLSPENNPGLRDLIAYTNQAINDTYNREGLAQKALFARAGHKINESSPFAKVQADLASSRMDAIGKNVAQLTSQAYESERGRQVAAVEQQRANAEMEFNRQLEYLQAEALPRLIDEVGFERGFEEFNNRISMLAQSLGLLGQVTAPALGTVGTTQGKSVGFSLLGTGSSSAGTSSAS